MSLVSAHDQARALALVGSGSPKRDELLFSLARKLIWTTAQRELLDRIWAEEKAKRAARRQANGADLVHVRQTTEAAGSPDAAADRDLQRAGLPGGAAL